MKKFIQFFAVTAILTISSCSKDFLDTSPVTEATTENFYKIPSEAFQGLVAVYDALQQGGDAWGGSLLTSEIASDNCFLGFGSMDGTGINEWDRFQIVPNSETNNAVWKTNYLGIARANILLEHLDQVNWGSDTALRTQYEAEAKFLRAYFHFELARTFGDIIPLDHTIKTTDNTLPRVDAATTYALIARDLKFAVDNLGNDNYSTPNNAKYGRITKWAAETYMAKVYLFYTGYYNKPDLAGIVTQAQATTYINDVINNSGHALIPDFSQLWVASAASSTSHIYAGEGNTEDIFAIRYDNIGKGDWNLHDGNRLVVNIAPRGGGVGVYSNGWGGGTVNPALVAAYQAGDTRKAASFIDFVGEGLTYDPNASNISQRQYTGYSWKKYCPVNNASGVGITTANGGNFQIDNYEDIVILRFADALLLAAELNITSNPAFAQTCLDRVRDRAFGDNTHHVVVSKTTILNERRLELALEGNRYYDLLRQGMAVAKAAIDITSSTNDVNIGFNTTFRSETLGWFAIPQTQILLSAGGISQNPGW
jgi:hypothetical protein